MNTFYPIAFRVVRVKVAENYYQNFITNLSPTEFPAEKIKKIHHMRWRIETSFLELKYALGLASFHAKKVTYISQKVFARLIMYNFCAIITLQVMINQKSHKYGYLVNYTLSIQICRHFFRCLKHARPPNVETLMHKHIFPIR